MAEFKTRIQNFVPIVVCGMPKLHFSSSPKTGGSFYEEKNIPNELKKQIELELVRKIKDKTTDCIGVSR